MTSLRLTFFAFLLLLSPFSLNAAEPLNAQEAILDNGMKLVVLENRRAPVITHMVWFYAGAADEPRGVSGVAHYLEHMMFKGAKGLKNGEYSETVQRYGGRYNAFTGQDYTAYYVTVASKHINDIMALEAKRLQFLKPARESFVNEREVVVEERRMRTENHPSARLREKTRAVLFSNHPYRFPVIGWKHEMLGLTYDDVMEFYDVHYRPDNAVIVMAGDINMAEAKALAQKHFSSWKAPEGVERPSRDWVKEPPRETSEYVTLTGEDISKEQWSRIYAAPSFGESKDISKIMARVVMAELLGGSKSSLMHQDLVVNTKKATSASASYDAFSRGPGVFGVSITPADGVSLDDAENAYITLLKGVISKGISDNSLVRTKNRLKAETIYARDGIENMAFLFGQLVMLDLDSSFFNDWGKYIDAVDEADVIDAMREQLLYEYSVTGRLIPEGDVQ